DDHAAVLPLGIERRHELALFSSIHRLTPSCAQAPLRGAWRGLHLPPAPRRREPVLPARPSARCRPPGPLEAWPATSHIARPLCVSCRPTSDGLGREPPAPAISDRSGRGAFAPRHRSGVTARNTVSSCF